MSSIERALERKGQPEDQYCDPICYASPDGWTPPIDPTFHQSGSSHKRTSATEVKEAIRQETLPVLGLEITEKFHDPAPPWIFSSGSPTGLHAVVAVGLAEYKGDTIVLIRNSWGKKWAKSGHAWLDDSFLNEHLYEMMTIDN